MPKAISVIQPLIPLSQKRSSTADVSQLNTDRQLVKQHYSIVMCRVQRVWKLELVADGAVGDGAYEQPRQWAIRRKVPSLILGTSQPGCLRQRPE